MWNLPPDYDKEQTLPFTSLKAHWHFIPFTRECISMAILVCAHGTIIPTNCEPSTGFYTGFFSQGGGGGEYNRW